MVRAKFKCESRTIHEGGSSTLSFRAVTNTSEENQGFWKYTPSGELKIQCAMKETADKFEPGKEYYIDFSPAE